jgi:hypothetical protein
MYYNVKVAIATDTEKGVKEKFELYMVEALSIVEAESKINKDFEGYPNDWHTVQISETKIMKVIN